MLGVPTMALVVSCSFSASALCARGSDAGGAEGRWLSLSQTSSNGFVLLF